MGYAKQTIVVTKTKTRTRKQKQSNVSNKSKRCPKCGRYL